MVKYDVAPGYPNPDGSPVKSTQHGARLVRWTFDLNNDSTGYTEEALCDLQVEFPRIDERFAMQSYHHGWVMSGSANTSLGEASDRGSIAHINLDSGQVSMWRPQTGDFCSEPVFVARSADAPEGDGFVLSVIFRGAENRSDLAVFDAQKVANGPVALVHLSHRVPAGFHGNWRAAV
jgi:carotenoid cleavage dioxygenase